MRIASANCTNETRLACNPRVTGYGSLWANLLCAVAFGCSGTDSPSAGVNGGNPAIGGSVAAGNSAIATTLGGKQGLGGSLSAGANSVASGGAQTTGGKSPTGGALTGGSQFAAGGQLPTGGTIATGGTTTPATRVTGGAVATGGSRPTGGATATGGAVATGGSRPTGGATATGGSAANVTGPCDIYASANTPCVAAHSTVRALFGNYTGPLYQLRRASDGSLKDVPVSAAGGFADISVQNSFCTGTTCTISILYDQTSNKNHLAKSPKAYWLADGGNEANAANGQITVSGHTVHGIYVTGYSSNVAYRNNATKGVATGNQAEAMYMVVDGKRYSNQCCFDYGNAETSGNDDGNGTMEAVYFGSDTTWGGKGSGNGPWVAADLENGVFKSNQGGWQTTAVTPGALSITANFVTAMLKGPAANTFALKGGSAQSGTLTTMWNGARPSASGYYPKRLQGAIILGTGGDGSNGGTGTFFEGAITNGNPPDATDDLIQANIVAAGYGK